MKKYQLSLLLNALLISIFVLFIISHEARTTEKRQQDVDAHAQVVASSVWTLFTPVTEQYLSLSVHNNDYQKIHITSLDDYQLFSYSSQLQGLEAMLQNLGLIRVEEFSTPVIYKQKPIGILTVHAFNKNIYLYGYLFLVLLLTSLLCWFVNAIYSERKNLQFRVADKTAELAGNNEKLCEEIAERKHSERALRESEQTFATLFENSFQFVALLDPECRVLKVNQTALSFRDLKESDVLGKQFWDTPWWRHSERLTKQLKEAYTTALSGQIGRFEAHSTGVREIYLDVSLKPVLDDQQQLIYIIAEAREVTDIKRAEQELQQAQKMESVGTLAGGIAHDFNNILGGILGTLALLKLKRDKGQPLGEADLYQRLDTITETAMRAKDMVNQLLALSRKYDLKFRALNLRQVLNNVCQIAATSFDKSISLDIQLEDEIPVYADENSLEQVFLNICINAAHAMTIMRAPGEAWGGTLKIRLKKSTEESRLGRDTGIFWCISLIDNGIGMDNANLEQIFVPFFTTKTKDAGTGLGLSMVYNIVKQHNGFIEVESTKGTGSSFHIYLPVSELSFEEKSPTDEILVATGTGSILIIDDEELIRNSARDILDECGYRVFSAENGQQGIEIYRQQQIDAVLLDLVMPVMSGKETYDALKEIDPEIKVLLSSGFRQDARVDEILASGANAFIQKPYSLQNLSIAIKQLFN